MSKNLHWDDNIFKMIDWKGMESTLGKMKDTEVTNVLKMVHLAKRWVPKISV